MSGNVVVIYVHTWHTAAQPFSYCVYEQLSLLSTRSDVFFFLAHCEVTKLIIFQSCSQSPKQRRQVNFVATTARRACCKMLQTDILAGRPSRSLWRSKHEAKRAAQIVPTAAHVRPPHFVIFITFQTLCNAVCHKAAS